MDYSLTTLYVLPNGNLAPDGFKRESLQPTQFGIFNSRYKAVTTANDANKSPYIVFGQGRIEKVPGLTSKYSDKISKGSLIEWYKTTASPTAKNQITYVGFDGIDPTKNIEVGCDEQWSVTIRARSLYLDLAFAYGLTRTVTVTTPCCEDCSDNCAKVDPRWVANKAAELMNAEPWISKIVSVSPLSECDPVQSAPASVSVTVYSVSVPDAGDAAAQAYVQGYYPDDVVEFESRNGAMSTYSVTRLTSAGAPSALPVVLPISLAICDVCPPTFSLQVGQNSFIVKRPLAGNETLATSGNKQTYANTVKAAYVAPKTFDGATAVDPATNQITVTGHGLTVGDSVVYSNGGGTTIVGLTNGATYYVQSVPNANNVTLSATKGGAVVDITADGVGAAHTLTSSSTATFLKIEDGQAFVRVFLEEGVAVPTAALSADTLLEAPSVEAYCIPPAGTTATWSATDLGLRFQRQMFLTITDDCTPDLAKLQAQYALVGTVALVESNNCNSKYSITQTSETVFQDCDINEPPVYTQLQSYKGIEWEAAPYVAQDPMPDCAAGLRIEGKPLDKYGNPCDPIAFPHEFDKLTFEVFAYKGAPTTQDFITFDRCDNTPITYTQKSTFALGSGDEIFMMEKQFHGYQTYMKHIYHNNTWNGGFVRYSDPNVFYDTYVLKFKSPDLLTWDASTRQDETVIIAVPSGTGGALENFLVGYFGDEKFTAGVLSV